MKQFKYGLIGKNISYSFSEKYFAKKFQEFKLETHSYKNFDIQSTSMLKDFITNQAHQLVGFNVTTPYKEIVIPYLDVITKKAANIGAVNVVKIVNDTLIGYNTDAYGFKKSIQPLLKKHHKKALVLGTGGASKAIAYVLKKSGLKVRFVSRSKTSKHVFSYTSLSEKRIKKYSVIVNCTPLGTFPDIEQCPNIPYQFIGKKHLLFDLIYNPQETRFLKKGKQQGAKIINGHKMLELQAEKSWKIWNETM